MSSNNNQIQGSVKQTPEVPKTGQGYYSRLNVLRRLLEESTTTEIIEAISQVKLGNEVDIIKRGLDKA